jgi:hypothetical protein
LEKLQKENDLLKSELALATQAESATMREDRATTELRERIIQLEVSFFF